MKCAHSANYLNPQITLFRYRKLQIARRARWSSRLPCSAVPSLRSGSSLPRAMSFGHCNVGCQLTSFGEISLSFFELQHLSATNHFKSCDAFRGNLKVELQLTFRPIHAFRIPITNLLKSAPSVDQFEFLQRLFRERKPPNFARFFP